jgi:hypothetical protein
MGCDLHARQQMVAMLDTDTGEFVGKTLEHDGEELGKFYSGLWPIYREYDAEQTKHGDEKLAVVGDYAQNFLTMTNEKAGDLAQRDAQAACRCNSWASKHTPFFQIVKVIAAILRAKVRRAIAGLLPFASSAA